MVPTGHRFPTAKSSSQCILWLSFLHTAAGQFRIRTGFPFKTLVTQTFSWFTDSEPQYSVLMVQCQYHILTFQISLENCKKARARHFSA
jgi:hypothetical protein